MLKLIIFDWDGTLSDSVGQIIACKQFLAQRYGLEMPSAQTVKSVLGIGFEEAMRICFPSAPTALLSQLGQDFQQLIRTPTYRAELFPGVKPLLAQLKAEGFQIAIATGKSRHSLNQALMEQDLNNIVGYSCCAEEYVAKPNPAMLQHLMAHFNVCAEECLMVGDTTFDLEFSANAQIKSVGVNFGTHSKAALASLDPWAIIDDWSEFLLLISPLRKPTCTKT